MKKAVFTPTRFDISDTYYDAKLLKNVSTGNIHWHSHFLISIFKRGSGTQFLNNIEHKFEPGTAIIMGPFDFHYNKIEKTETFDTYSIKFTYKVFNEHLCKICNLDHFPIVSKLSERDYLLSEKICDFLIEEKDAPDSPEKEILINNFIEQLVIMIMRNSKKECSVSSSDTTIRQALLYIHDNFRQDITVKDVADLCHYTPNYFSTCFKKKMGITFQKYLHDLRLEFAYNILNYGSKSCSEACFESGFNSLEYFSTAFKKKFGNSPKFYVKS